MAGLWQDLGRIVADRDPKTVLFYYRGKVGVRGSAPVVLQVPGPAVYGVTAMHHVVWLRRDATVITRVHETDHGYMMIELIDRRTGKVILGPRPAKISPEKLVAYGFKQMAA